MSKLVSYRSMLLIGLLSVSIFSLNTFVVLPSAVVSYHTQQLLQSAFATFPGENGKIAFTTQRDGDFGDIYVMNADGSEQTNISNNPAHDLLPDWGPAVEAPEEDSTAPVLTVPDDIITQATTANGRTVVTYNVTAEDNVDGTAILEEDNTTIQDEIGGNITISCDPASGSEFPIGDTEVQCIATDEADNEGTASFTVTVLPPQPDPLIAEISSDTIEGDAPATFEFEAMVTGGTQPYTYSWDFGDGTTEEESIEPTTSHTYEESGTYTVTLTVIDSEGQEATDSLEVTVNESSTEPPPPPTPTTPREAIERLISYIENLQDVPENAKTSIVTVLERALVFLSDSNTRNDASACNMFGAFINQVNANERRDTLTEDQADDLRTQAADIRDMSGC
jgi:PKD repeat protein